MNEKLGIKKLNNLKVFIDYSQTTDDVYENLKDYNPIKKNRVPIVSDNVIADMESNKNLSPIVTELYLRGRKLNISLVFVSQSYFEVPKTIRLNATHYCLMKIYTKRELQKISSNHLPAIDFKDFIKLIKIILKNTSILVNDTTL